ncbi:tRNA (guanosine(46)-N7)-methyltransferase TrmB [Pontibacter sp. G13]|uniref:tRNA (guanosine(46)-N7)-methyltransferase TrmB n=1 Tax=Pontibacter sp. G13 TaxID=3074898 RepID=UPI00288A6648|nr:tRNA (guanosine(46)-N7)-methyltransferase TrmB [Pontibacter sp. G13]WNJ20405.1 tRNA (guanosine(46)-N7)-methyltransferase TrmB [Pontibacter sp. G13]
MSKRKKLFKKAAYQETDRCFVQDHKMAGKWSEVFGNDHPITMELGCGKADFSYGLAEKYPERNFVGVDLKMDRMWYPARRAEEAGIRNLAFVCTHLLQLGDQADQHEIDEIWITFPDPFPKKRQAKHRMVNENFLRVYHQALKSGGRLHFKSDNRELFLFGLEVFVKAGLNFHTLTFDLHANEEIGPDPKVKTAYERKFMEMGIPINYVVLSFPEGWEKRFE